MAGIIDEVVVAIDAGSNRGRDGISPAGKAILEAAIGYLNASSQRSVLAYCNADLPHQGMREEDSARWKGEIVNTLQRKPVPHIEVPARISIDEALNIHN